MQQRMTSQLGFSLVELMIAIVLLTFGLLGLAQLQVTAMRTTTHSAGMLGANALGQRIVEEIMSFPPDATEITNAAGQPFLSTTVTNRPLIYRDSRRPGIDINYSNVMITNDQLDITNDGSVNNRDAQATAGNYQVTYTTTPNYTNQPAGEPQVCMVDITVTDRTESKFRNRLDFRVFKNWAP